MSKVFFISDLHLKHASVLNFRENYRSKALNVTTIEEHDQKIFDLWNDKVSKRDKVFVLGDLGYDIGRLKKLPGSKVLHIGNHDRKRASEYLNVFDDIIGPIKHKGFWISHFPIHPCELWGKKCIHGHIHSLVIPDPMYINVSIEHTKGEPIDFDDIQSGKFTTWDKGDSAIEYSKQHNSTPNL